jgi:predicted GNAT superfamily acetyltransferase
LFVRDVTSDDFPALLRLNLESEHFLSPLPLSRLQHLHSQAWYHRVVEDDSILGFLLALRQGADYDSPNYRWFADRFDEFLYIDRVVIDAAARGKRLASQLYADLFRKAREHGFDCVTCEFDTDPPNEASRRFHESFGFKEVGTQRVAGGKKAVSLQEARL